MAYKNKAIGITASVLVACGLIYGGAYAVLRNQLTSDLKALGIQNFHICGFKLYLDGVVIKSLTMNNQLELSKIYYAGAPWKLLSNKPDYIYIKKLTADADRLFAASIRWPFHKSIPLTVSNARIRTSMLGRTITLDGSLKQSPDTPLLFDFESSSPEVIGSGQTEIRVKKQIVKNIDIEFQDASLSFPLLKTKRSAGWVSYSWDKKWNVVGEIESGFANIPQNQFFDSTLKLNGPLESVDFTFSGISTKEKTQWVFDHHEGNLYVRHKNAVTNLVWNGFTNHMVEDVSLEMIKAGLPVEKQKSDKGDQSVQTVKNPEHQPHKIATQTKPVEPVAIPQESSLKIESVKLPEVSLEKLIANSMFQGFFYNQPMVYLTHDCQHGDDKNCWTARAQGGHLSYNPQATPGYFIRLKDYEQSIQLRYILLSFDVQSMTVSGKGDKVNEITVKGKDVDGRLAYIELSVADLE